MLKSRSVKTEEVELLESSVFARTGRDEISANAYNFIIGATLLWGFIVNYLLVTGIDTAPLREHFGILLLGYFASCFAGIYLFASYNNPIVSFTGYNLVVVPFGVILNVVVHQFSPTLVQDAFKITAAVTLIMMLCGSLFPVFFSRLERVLFFSLLVTIVVELFQMFFIGAHPKIMDWIVALIFCGYIGLDWGRANAIPKTVDNAIDSAAALYMDIVNLFVRVLAILGRRD